MRSISVGLLSGLALAAVAGAQTSGYTGHGAESVPPEVVAKFAPAPLDPEVSARIQQALDVRSPSLGLLSPDGKRLFFTWTVTGVSQIWRLDGPNRFPVQMTGGEDRTSLSDITPDGKWLVVSRDHGGQEDPGLYLQPAEGGPLRVVQHQPKSRAFYAFTSPDSRYIYFSANDREPASYAFYRWDTTTGKKELLFGEPGLWFVADYRWEDGEPTVLFEKAVSSRAQEFYTLRGGKLEPLFGQGEEVRYSAAWGPQPGEVLVTTDKMGEFTRLYRWTKAAGFQPLTPEMKKPINGFGIDQSRRRVLYEINDGGYTRLAGFDASTWKPLTLPQFEGADHVYAGRPTPDGRYVVLGVETAKAPRSAHVLDWETGKLESWTVASAPEMETSRFAVARLEHYPARDGTQIPMFVRYPEGCDPKQGAPKGPCPVLVEFHGGPEGQATPGFSALLQTFIDAGFIFAEPNVRGSEGYGKTWLDADNGAKRLEVITDIEDAARHLRKSLAKGGKEPRIGVYGGSYGGYATLVAMTMFAGAYDAGASVVGISDLRTFLRNTAPYRRQLRTSEYGDLEKDAEALAKLSPSTYLDRVQDPLLLIQGVDDPRVPAGEAVQMYEAMKAKGLDAELILIAGEGHGSARRASRVMEYGHTLRFFEEHLKEKKSAGAP